MNSNMFKKIIFILISHTCGRCCFPARSVNVASAWDVRQPRKNFRLIPVKCRLDVSWNLHQCLVIVVSAAARHYGDSLPSSGNCQGIFWCV